MPVTGGAPRILTSGLDRNVSRPQFAPDGAILFMVEEGGNVHLARVAATGGSVARILDGERDLNAFDVGKNGDVAILQSQPQQPSEVYVVRRATLSGSPNDRGAAGGDPERVALQQVTHVNDELLAKIALGPVERFKARSADGTMIDAFLTRPPFDSAQGRANAPSARLPTILRSGSFGPLSVGTLHPQLVQNGLGGAPHPHGDEQPAVQGAASGPLRHEFVGVAAIPVPEAAPCGPRGARRTTRT